MPPGAAGAHVHSVQIRRRGSTVPTSRRGTRTWRSSVLTLRRPLERETVTTTIDLSRVRPALQAIEPVFGAGVLSPAVLDALNGLGLELDGVAEVNLVTRSAPLGPISLDLAVATFYNPNPDYIATVIPRVWEKASPDEILAAQEAAFSPLLGEALSTLDPAELRELATLCRTAGDAAATNREGRALFAGMASRPWPTEDHLVIWNTAKLLREHRGDGHIACLVVEDLDAIDALVIHAAFDGFPAAALRGSRQWPEEPWDASVADLRERGWLTDDAEPTLSADGKRRRQDMEDRTDALAAVAYEPLGNDGMERMIELGGAMVAALGAAGLMLPRR